MKILYFGGQKSGKSLKAEQKALSLSKKPIYVATYDKSFSDEEMRQRIKTHKTQRKDKFETIESPRDLTFLEDDKTYLIDCLSMWILNLMDEEETLFRELEFLKETKANIVFVLNDVGNGVIPMQKFSRKFVDLTGKVGQVVASFCDEVYEVKFGLEVKLK
jgi:adenosylcobinamide kinase/adenosylcobinamide-phosphate guanylyltransferase